MSSLISTGSDALEDEVLIVLRLSPRGKGTTVTMEPWVGGQLIAGSELAILDFPEGKRVSTVGGTTVRWFDGDIAQELYGDRVVDERTEGAGE